MVRASVNISFIYYRIIKSIHYPPQGASDRKWESWNSRGTSSGSSDRWISPLPTAKGWECWTRGSAPRHTPRAGMTSWTRQHCARAASGHGGSTRCPAPREDSRTPRRRCCRRCCCRGWCCRGAADGWQRWSGGSAPARADVAAAPDGCAAAPGTAGAASRPCWLPCRVGCLVS